MQEAGTSNQMLSQDKIYIPPHLRRLRESAKDGSTGGKRVKATPTRMGRVYAFESIKKYYWPIGEDSTKDVGGDCRDDDGNRCSIEVARGWNGAFSRDGIKTLHGSAERPGKLAYITIFPDGNPRWGSDGIIFAKSSLDLLEPFKSKAEAIVEDYVVVDTVRTSTTITSTHTDRICDDQTALSLKTNEDLVQKALPIPVFVYKGKIAEAELFSLVGHFRILRVDFLEPRSEELKRMMKQKWDSPWTGKKGRERDMNKWNASFSRHWAVVQLVPAEEEEEEEEGEGEGEEAEDKAKKEEQQQEGSIMEGSGMAESGKQQRRRRRRRPGSSLNARLEEKLEPYDFKYSRIPRQLRRIRIADDEAEVEAASTSTSAPASNVLTASAFHAADAAL